MKWTEEKFHGTWKSHSFFLYLLAWLMGTWDVLEKEEKGDKPEWLRPRFFCPIPLFLCIRPLCPGALSSGDGAFSQLFFHLLMMFTLE
jgi:hypothetical protein